MKLIATVVLLSCACSSHGYTRVAPHTDAGYHAQALLVQPVGLVVMEQLLDVQAVDGIEGYISETNTLYPLGSGWSVFVYFRADKFGPRWEERLGAGVQWAW